MDHLCFIFPVPSGSLSGTDTNADSYCYTDGDSYCYTNSYRDCHPNSYRDTYSDRYCYAYRDADGNSNGYAWVSRQCLDAPTGGDRR